MRTRTGAKTMKPREPEETRQVVRPNSKVDALKVSHDPVNEIVVISAALVDSEVRRSATASISADEFFGKGHAEIWLALQELERRKLQYDPATLRNLSGVVDIRYVEEMIRQRPAVPPNLRHHIEQLHFDRARIEMARGPLQDMLEAIRDPRVNAERLRAIADRMGAGLRGHGSDSEIRSGVAVAREQRAEIARRVDGQACRPFGIPGLDNYEPDHPTKAGRPRLVPGTVPGNVTVVTGLSGSGKSTTMANSILGMVRDGRRPLLGAWEQGSGMLLELCATISLGYSREDLMTGRFNGNQLDAISDEMARLGEWVKFFELKFGQGREKSGVNDRQLDKINQVVVDSGCDVFVADLFRRALKETNPDDEEQALYRMQAMAKETKCHFILVQQQRSKEVEKSPDKRPTRDNIKGSSAWVEIADQIIGWHRPAQWKNIPDDRIEALILKQRYGVWPECVELEWDPEFGHVGEGRTVKLESSYDAGADSLVDDDFFDRGKSKKR